MYPFRGTSSPIREAAPPYGPRDDAERFPADEVLADLERPTGADASGRFTRILARYAALRYWLLRVADAPPAVTGHARRAARAYLLADREWPEGALLLSLVDARVECAGATLSAAAAEAAAAGDDRGAAALRRAGREATLLGLRPGPPPPRP